MEEVYVQSIETIVRDNPHLTGAEILSIHSEQKQQRKIWEAQRDSKMLEIQDYLLKNKYFRIRYEGTKMTLFLRVDEVKVTSDNIYIEGESKSISYNGNKLFVTEDKEKSVYYHSIFSGCTEEVINKRTYDGVTKTILSLM